MSELFVGFVIGLVVGGVLAWLAREETLRLVKSELKEARKQEAIATDRLVHAWHAEAKIPPRPQEALLPPEPLPATLQAELDVWEDQEHRAMLEAQMRSMLRAGKDPVRILLELDNVHP